MIIGIGLGLQYRNNSGIGGDTPPVNTVAPAITGLNVVGQLLTCSTGTWTGNPAPSYTYQWYRGVSPIALATNNTYTLVQADAGNTANISCVVTADNGIGAPVDAPSNTIAQIFDADAYFFITTALTTGSTQMSAVNQFVLDCKGQGITTNNTDFWANLVRILGYVPIDNTTINATTCTICMKNPASPISFTNFVSGDFALLGVTGGVGKYASWNVAPTSLNTNIGGLVMSRTPGADSGRSFGASDAGLTNAFHLLIRNPVDTFAARLNNSGAALVFTPNTDGSGVYSINRIGNARVARKGTTTIASDSLAPTARTAQQIVGHAFNNGGVIQDYDMRQNAGFMLWENMTANNVIDAIDAFTKLQTALGR